MPGIPPNGTSQAEAFWISFWAALYSGVLYSLVTGFVVSLGVWFAQSRVERTRLQNQFEMEIALLREELRGVVSKPDVLIIISATNSAPPTAQGVIKLLKERPLDLWLASARKWKGFLMSLRRAEKAYSKFIRVAEALDFELRQFIRKHNAARNTIAANDPVDHAFFNR